MLPGNATNTDVDVVIIIPGNVTNSDVDVVVTE